ncbi:restriction endonuclease subunit S [Pseudoalteromonas piscicida]|uniref:restriction endonuclease subunit S n=1 Tax=Pseudoalteromonas piscicida TaxID=43662 RepID=UPI001C94B148|nr:restriction endonuclease subunit S [Pseudoalteromonas piscicida]QZO12903.1 restriction endonuclease subunit S [Pseudoalteromonas piscicida]
MTIEKPIGWEKSQLSDILTLKNGFAFKSSSYKDTGVPILRISDIQEGLVSPVNAKCIDENEEYEEYVVNQGDILIAMSGATTGKFGIFNSSRKAYQNQRVGRFFIYSKKLISNSFVYYLLFSLKREIEKSAYGGAQPNISSKKIESMDFLLPPTNEQIRIVEKIEELFSELDKGIESLKTAKAQLAVYRQALLKHAFEGKLTEQWRKDNADKLESPEKLLTRIQKEREARYQKQLDNWKLELEQWEVDGKEGKKPQKPRKAQIKQTDTLVDDLPNEWSVYSLSEISEHIVDGTHKTPKYVSEGVKFISAKDIFGFKVSFENTRFITEEEHKELIKRCNPKKGNVLITKSGTLGRVAVVKDELEFSLFESVANVPVLPPMISEFVSKQVYYVINTGFGASIQKGVAVRHLHLEDLRKLPLSICSVEEQQEICLRLDSEFTLLDSLESELEVNLRKCEVLRQSILKKAFSGHLVPQDLDDEPASELLKKVAGKKAELAKKEKAEKAAARKAKAAAKKAKT